MARRGSQGSAHQTRIERERVRLYQARAQWQVDQKRRRVRDNIVAGVAGGLLVIGAFASQAVHAAVTAPEPTPTVTPTPEPDPAQTETPEPTGSSDPTDSPAPEETPAEEETPAP